MRSQRKAGAEFGTADRSPSELLEAILNSRSLKVTKTVDKKTVTDEAATTAANEMAKKIRDKFKSWVWTDSDRAADLVEAYNLRYNNLAPRRFDDQALATGRTDGLEQAFQQWNITASQAVPALLWAPAGRTVRVVAREWGRVGTAHRVTVRGLAAGETVCVRGTGSRSLETAGLRGVLRSSVRLPRRSGVRTVLVEDSTRAYRTTVRTVGPKRLGIRVARRPLKAGAVQRIVVRGLVGGEPAQVFVRGRRVARGEAGPRGVFVARARLPKAGPARVRATGVLPRVRVGRTAFRVVR